MVLFLLSWDVIRWTESLHFLETLFSSVKCWVPCLTESIFNWKEPTTITKQWQLRKYISVMDIWKHIKSLHWAWTILARCGTTSISTGFIYNISLYNFKALTRPYAKWRDVFQGNYDVAREYFTPNDTFQCKPLVPGGHLALLQYNWNRSQWALLCIPLRGRKWFRWSPRLIKYNHMDYPKRHY